MRTAEQQVNPSAENRCLSSARSMIRLGRYSEALVVVSEGLEAAPDSVDLLAERASLLRAMGLIKAARDGVVALAERRPDHPRLPELRAGLAEASGDLETAERICSDHVGACPQDAKGLARWAHFLTLLGRHREASIALRRGLGIDPHSAEILIAKVELLTAAGQLQQAEAALQLLSAWHPTHSRQPRLRAELAEAGGDLGAAERACAGEVAAHPDEVGPRVRWARSLARLGRYQEASAAVSEGLDAAPASVELLAERALLLIASGQFETAGAAVETLAARCPDHPRLPQMRAKCGEAAGEFHAAERLWADHVAAHPRDVAGRLRWVRCLAGLGRHDRALGAISEGLESASGNPDFLAERASLLKATGRFEAAAADIESLAVRHPDQPRLSHLRAGLAEATGDLDTAAHICAADAAKHPRDAARRLRWTRCLARLGRHGEALAALSDGLRTDPDNLALLTEQAFLFTAAGQLEAAEHEIAALETRCAGHPRLLYLRGLLAQAVGDLETAQRVYAADAAAFPEDVERRVRWLRCLQNSGQIAEVLAWLDARRPSAQAEWQLWLDCLLEAGRWDETSALLDAWPHQDVRGQLMRLRFRADLAMMRLDHAAAMVHARTALGIAPHDHNAAQALARSAACMFQIDLAWRMLGQVRIRGATGGGPPRRGVGRLRHLVGQMVNDFRLRPEATAELAAAANRDDQTLIATGAAQLRADPGSFGAALGLLTGLARAGRFAAPDVEHRAGSTRIPKIVHQYWDSETAPPDIERPIRRAKNINSDCRHRRWDDAAARRYLAGLDVPDALAAYIGARHAAMRSDIFRLAVLHDMGGLYLDADDYCARPLRTLIAPDAELVCYQENIGSIGNNFLAAVPRHPVIAAALAEAIQAVLDGASETLWLVTGPGLISRAVAASIAHQPDCGIPAGLRVLPLNVFRGVVHTLRTASYKADTRSWKRIG